MRQLLSRPSLPAATVRRLAKETTEITNNADSKSEAKRRYENARKARWFKPIIRALQIISGPDERCMCCSGSESSQIEHFRPKAVFPRLAMTWENFLWACGSCNRFKGDRFPLDTQSGALLINPIEENVWDFFFIDEFGNLTPRWRNDLNDLDPRAESTQKILGLDRQALQETRQSRLLDLKRRVEDSMKLFQRGDLTREQLRERHSEWLKQPFQPDVADYFLNGPGCSESPFKEYFQLITN